MNSDSFIVRLLAFYGSYLPNHPRKWWVHAHLRQFLKVTVDEEMEVVRGGLRWSLNPSDFEHEELFWLGSKDTWELTHLCGLLDRGCVFLDIGANCGYYSLFLAKAFQGDCDIHAFEPHPVTYARLAKHINWNDMANAIHAHRTALSDTAGTAKMVERADNSGATRLSGSDDGFEVQTVTLDEFVISQRLSRVDCLKIDVEGVEARVLRGGCQTIERFKPIVLIEFWKHGLTQAGSSIEEVATVLDELGYLLFELHSRKLNRLTELPLGADPENVLCFHRDNCPV